MKRAVLLGLVAVTSALAVAVRTEAATSATHVVRVVDELGAPVADAVVELRTSGTRAPAGFPWRAAMAQKDLTFVPGTLVVAKGSSVAFPNLDRVRHSVYSFSAPARFSIELYGRDQSRTQGFAVAGTVAVGCKIHDSMRAYIRVVDTPFAGKTDANGRLTLSGAPVGAATLVVWHPAARAADGQVAGTIGVAAGGGTTTVALPLKR